MTSKPLADALVEEVSLCELVSSVDSDRVSLK